MQRLWKRMWTGTNSTSLTEHSSVKFVHLCISRCMGGCLHPHVDIKHTSLLSCCNSPTGDLRADRGRETTYRWPKSGQKGTFSQSHLFLLYKGKGLIPLPGSIFSPFHTLLTILYFARQVYYEPMLKLDIMTESELGQIFGTLDSLIPLHQGKPSLSLLCKHSMTVSKLFVLGDC